MMKKVIIALAALAILAWGCSADDNDLGTDARPAWQAPNYDLFEQVMNVQVQMQDTLTKYVSKNDLLCATIDGEVRAVTVPLQVGDGWVAPLMVASNDAGVAVELSYYCEQLHRIFTIAWTTFDASVAPTGTGGIYQPEFIKPKN
jgi:hypothetical protein